LLQLLLNHFENQNFDTMNQILFFSIKINLYQKLVILDKSGYLPLVKDAVDYITQIKSEH